MVRLMVGRDLKVAYSPPAIPQGKGVLSAQNVRTPTYPNREVSLDVHAGEILGLAGLVGAGRTELARVLFGIDRPHGGTLTLNGQSLRLATSADAVKAGIFLVPEDRKGAGLLLDFPITENVTLPNLPAYARNNIVSQDAERKRAETSRRELDIRAVDVAVRTGSLLGGFLFF